MLAKHHMLKYMNCWPPYLGAGVRVRHIAKDFRRIKVEMKLRWWNRNYVGTHFGGSLYAMVDPFYMLMLIENLGRDYIVWDKAATIRFKKPGRGVVYADFELRDEDLATIHKALATAPKLDHHFTVEVKDRAGTVIAEIDKILYIRRKKPQA